MLKFNYLLAILVGFVAITSCTKGEDTTVLPTPEDRPNQQFSL